MTANLMCESPADRVRVARFLRPDLRAVLYDDEDVARCALYKELRAAAIDGLPTGGTLVLNFGLVEWFPSIFYAFLLRTLEDVRAKGARVVVCCLPPTAREAYDLLNGPRQFETHSTEARAVAEAGE